MEMKRQLIVGLPGTGKTTFLAALWHVGESGEVPVSLVVSEVHGVRDYLNKIREDWLNCRQLERTTVSAETVVSFRLQEAGSGNFVELSLPDLSGETFRHQWESRQWTPGFDQLASEASGILLFVHPRTVVEPIRIDSTLDAIEAAIGYTEQTAESGPVVAQSAIQAWSPAHAPTHVKLVEILQFLQARSFLSRPMPLAVIVSAWDLIVDVQQPPEWLQQRLPLLDQFLRANVESIPFEVFGISAQGGELSQSDELQQHSRASDRIMVAKVGSPMSHDITAPIRWLLNR